MRLVTSLLPLLARRRCAAMGGNLQTCRPISGVWGRGQTLRARSTSQPAEFGDPDKFGDLWEKSERNRQKGGADRSEGRKWNRDSEIDRSEGRKWNRDSEIDRSEGRKWNRDSEIDVRQTGRKQFGNNFRFGGDYAQRFRDKRGGKNREIREADSFLDKDDWEEDVEEDAVGTEDSREVLPPDQEKTRVIDWDLVDDDAEDIEEQKEQDLIAQTPKLHLSPSGFGRRMKKLIKNNKLREALELFFNQMQKVDRVRPDSYCYNILIAGCGQAGYTKMAFKLYNDMKKRRLPVKHVTYTSLLNACANGPSVRESLQHVTRLRQLMAERGYLMNPINYHALIKAYGRCGEVRAAFEAADEMLRLGHPLTEELVNFLLQACLSDSFNGFRHALLVWHRLRSKELAPSIFTYNLLLRAALDCSAGEAESVRRAIKLIVGGPPPEAPPARLPGSVSDPDGSGSVPQIRIQADRGLPDLIGREPTVGGLVKLNHLNTPESRLLLLGGWEGVLRNMEADGVAPDIKTFSILINTLPGDAELEEKLLTTMEERFGVKPDVGFFNQLIKKRAMRNDCQAARMALDLMRARQLQPNVGTYGCLAMTVRNYQQAEEYLQLLQEENVRPNVEMLTALLNSAVRRLDTSVVLLVMETFLQYHVPPDRTAIYKLELFRARIKQILTDQERGKYVPRAAQHPQFPEGARKFNLRYSSWLSEVEAEVERHPYHQYKVRPLGADTDN